MTTAFGTINDYLGRFAGDMAERVDRRLRPLFDPRVDDLSPEVRALDACAMKPKPAQALNVEGAFRQWQSSRTAWCNGETGTGKTCIAGWLVRAHVQRTGRPCRVVISAPNQLMAKWKGHIERIVPNSQVRIVQSWRDLLALRQQSVERRGDKAQRRVLVRQWRQLQQRRAEAAQRARAAYLAGQHDDAKAAKAERLDVIEALRRVEQDIRRCKPGRFALQPSQTEVWIMPRDRGKLSYAWRAGVRERTRLSVYREGGERFVARRREYLCPRCGCVVKDAVDGTAVGRGHFVNNRGKLKAKRFCDTKLFRRTVVDEASGATRQIIVAGGGEDGDEPVLDHDDCAVKCGEPLWQAHGGRDQRSVEVPPAFLKNLPDWMTQYWMMLRSGASRLPQPSIQPRRIAPCAMLRAIGMPMDIYISDEVHELRGHGSLQGQLLADLCRVSKRRLMLTGTLIGGYAHNLLHLLWRTDGSTMKRAGLEHSESGFEAFVSQYGTMKEEKRYVGSSYIDAEDLVQGRGKRISRRTKALPGISPLLFTNFLLERSTFLRLSDMAEDLPPFDWEVHELPLDPDMDAAMKRMQDEFADHRQKHRKSNAWSAARACFMRWPDKPWVEPYDVYGRVDDCMIKAFSVRSIARDQRPGTAREFPKQRKMREIIQSELANGRKCWVFTELTGQGGKGSGGSGPEWDVMEDYQAYLGKHGIRAAILRSQAGGGPKPEDREKWIADVMPSVDVVISNPMLVQTGLDLFDTPTIIFTYCGDSTYVLRQASRRAWRLGQDQPCMVHYLVYEGQESKSMQAAALSLMARKMAASLAIEGDFSDESLAALADDEDVSSQLARYIDGQLEVASAGASMDAYRRKFVEAMPSLGTQKPIERAAPPVEREVVEPPVVSQPAIVSQAKASQDRGRHGGGTHRRRRNVDSGNIPSAVAAWFGDRIVETGTRSRYRLASLGWIQIVTKARRTVRERDFHGFDGLIVFVEPAEDAGPSESATVELIGDRCYILSVLTAAEYREGQRVARDPNEEIEVAA